MNWKIDLRKLPECSTESQGDEKYQWEVKGRTDGMRGSKIYPIRIPEGDNRENKEAAIFEKLMDKNFQI